MRFFEKFIKLPLKRVNRYLIHTMRPGNERYNSNELFKTIFEDEQVTAAAYFQFQCQFLTNKITKLVDDFLNFQSLLESSIRP